MLAAGAVISIFSVTLVTMYGQTRILFAMGRDGLLPSMFAKVNPKSMTPVNNTIIVAIVVSLLAAFVPLDKLIDMVSIGTLTAFIVVSIGVIILRVREPDLPRGFKVPLYPVTPVLSVLACGYILYSLHWYTWIAFSAWVLVVWSFYLLWGRTHSALNDGGDGIIAIGRPRRRRCRDRHSAKGYAVTVIVGFLAGKAGISAAAPRRGGSAHPQNIAVRRHRGAQAVDDRVARAHRRRVRPVRGQARRRLGDSGR